MPALIREKEPIELAVDDLLTHAHQFVGVKGEIGGILVRTPVDGIFSRQIMPLLAGYLASPAGRAQGRIY
jgi:hypothetical protein